MRKLLLLPIVAAYALSAIVMVVALSPDWLDDVWPFTVPGAQMDNSKEEIVIQITAREWE